MKKKGLTYVDWSISIGLFIIYLLVLFITFRPAVRDEYSSDHLTSMVEKNLREDVYQTMVRFPVYVDTVGVGPGTYKVTLDNIDIGWDPSQTFLVDDEFQLVSFYLNEPDLRIDNQFEGGTNLFWLYHFDESYGLSSYFDCVVGPGCYDISSISYAFGVQEEVKGFYEQNFTDINMDKLDLRDLWNYPEGRDFNVSFFNGLDFTDKIWGYSTNLDPSTDEAEQVYVLQWSDWLLDPDPTDGIIDRPVTVVVKVW